MDASERSLRKLSFLLENSAAVWTWMITLTFREPHDDPKSCLKKWQAGMPWHDQECFDYAWWMEFQVRGMVHFHYFLTDVALDAFCLPWRDDIRDVGTGRKRRSVLGGRVGNWIVAGWCDAVGDCSGDFIRFQYGGIIERLRKPDAAARYAAKYASKKQQKELPPDQGPLGRWWFISAHAKPVPCGTKPLTFWPFSGPLGTVYDKQKLVPPHESIP